MTFREAAKIKMDTGAYIDLSKILGGNPKYWGKRW